jgi:polysaccharide pyruvyl transferase WcaK-like protein
MIISFYGGFGLGNFGNEATLQATIESLRRLLPDLELNCICTNPDVTAAAHGIPTRPISSTVVAGWRSQNRLIRAIRSIFIGVPSELYRWVEAFRVLKGTNVLFVPGTGLLTDAFGLHGWGPYSLFKWSLVAKLRGCKVALVSVGAGPVYTRTGRWLVRRALALADFRSYRDFESRDYLREVFPKAGSDRVYPDLAFTLPSKTRSSSDSGRRHRPVVGLGLMLYHYRLSGDGETNSTYSDYLEQLIVFVGWVLARDYDLRLLIGEMSDKSVVADFKALLKERLPEYDEERVVDGHVESAQDLLKQLAETDAVVATRFHNILLAMLLNKPVISISFHQKCSSLMKDMGLEEYCQDIKKLDGERLIGQFIQLEKNTESLRQAIGSKVVARRNALDEQYRILLQELSGQLISEDSKDVPTIAARV